MTGKRGENVTEVGMNIVGIGTFLFPMEFYVFVGKYLHYSTFNGDHYVMSLMMS